MFVTLSQSLSIFINWTISFSTPASLIADSGFWYLAAWLIAFWAFADSFTVRPVRDL